MFSNNQQQQQQQQFSTDNRVGGSERQQQQQQQQRLVDGIAYDDHGNEVSDDWDLGKDGAFNDFSVLVGIFYSEVATNWESNAGAALRKKGFRVTVTTDEANFVAQLRLLRHDVAWFVSGLSMSFNEAEFRDAVLAFHRDKRGLFIFGDNDPYFVQANAVLPAIAGCRLIGNKAGGRNMTFGPKPTEAGKYDDNHMLFTGINSLFEGITICFPDQPGKLKILATGTDGQSCIGCMERSKEGGRVVVDTGFTKLYLNWQAAGQARYVINSCVYLVDIEGRFENPLEDSLEEVPKNN